MGITNSQPISKEFFDPLLNENLTEQSEFFNNLQGIQISVENEKIIRSILEETMKEKTQNLILLLKKCIAALKTIIDKSNDKSIKQPAETVLVLLKYTVPILLSSETASKTFSEKEDDEISRGTNLYLLLVQYISLPHVAIRSKEKNWSSGTRDDSKFDRNRCIIVEIIILLLFKGYTHPNADFNSFVISAINCLRCHLNYDSKKNLKNVVLSRNLIHASLTLLLLLNINISSLEIDHNQVFEPFLVPNFRNSANEDLSSFIIPLAFHFAPIIRSKIKNDGIFILSNLFHLLDKNSGCYTAKLVMYVILQSIDEKELKDQINEPCQNFISSKPVHRGSFFDVYTEVISRVVAQSPEIAEFAIQSLSKLLFIARNISYTSSISIINLLSISKSQDLIKTMHYVVNNGIRNNISLNIVMLKNSRVFIQMQKLYPDLPELSSIVTMLKNINEELKQISTNFNATALEKFFRDPTCEHFANPVLRVPISSDLPQKKYIECLELMGKKFLAQELL